MASGNDGNLNVRVSAVGVELDQKLAALLFVDQRNQRAQRYRRQLGDVEGLVLPPAAPSGSVHAYHLFPVQVRDRARVYDALHDHGIGVQVHYVPTYRFGAYADLGLGPADFPATEAAYARLLSLPLYPDLTPDDQDRVMAVLVDALGPTR